MSDRGWLPTLAGGLVAGAAINLCEWAAHRWWLDAAWRAAFAALGREPQGWSTFIPANFVVGVVAVVGHRWLAAREGAGARTVAWTAVAVWVVFWVIPMLAMQPMAIFPDRLLALTIAVGALDAPLGTWAGVWAARRLGHPA